jgi:hypothetical protein
MHPQGVYPSEAGGFALAGRPARPRTIVPFATLCRSTASVYGSSTHRRTAVALAVPSFCRMAAASFGYHEAIRGSEVSPRFGLAGLVEPAGPLCFQALPRKRQIGRTKRFQLRSVPIRCGNSAIRPLWSPSSLECGNFCYWLATRSYSAPSTPAQTPKRRHPHLLASIGLRSSILAHVPERLSAGSLPRPTGRTDVSAATLPLSRCCSAVRRRRSDGHR